MRLFTDWLVVVVLLLAFTLVWGMIFTRARYSHAGLLALLMLVPIVNLILLLMLAFSEWPIEKELARLGGRSPPERPKRQPAAGELLVEDQEQTRDASFDEMFQQAVKLDQRGDWAEAVALFEQIADKLEGQQDAEYARNCAVQIREKMTRRV